MAKIVASAEGTVDAPADTVYGYIADMREHHPRFLPPAFSDFQVESGGVAELGLATELPAAIAQYRGHWIEYGVAERAYALQCPDDFAAIVSRYGHTAVKPKQYTTSAFLAGVLGVLSKHGTVLYHLGPATGRWKYNGTISWWAVPPAPDWESSRLSWSAIDQDMSYVPDAADTSR